MIGDDLNDAFEPMDSREKILRPVESEARDSLSQSSNLARRIRRILDLRQSRRLLSRRRALDLVVLAALVLLPFSTVQFSRAAPAVVISIALPPNMKPYVEDTGIFHDFEAAHPGVTVNVVEAIEVPDPVDGLDAYFTAMQKYTPSADVLYTASFPNGLAVVPHGTRAGYFLDLAPLVASDPSLNVDDFYPQVWKSYQWDKGIWALPTSSDLEVFSYDKAAFDRAGVAYPDDQWTLNDFANTVTRLTIKNSDGRITTPGFAQSGGIFRMALWQSLFDVQLFDETVVPNPPRFDHPSVEAVLDTYRQLEQQGFIGSYSSTAPMGVDLARAAFRANRSTALLPGGKAGLLTSAFAISAGTQQPDLAYELAKFMTTRRESNFMSVPARKSVAPENQPLVEQGLAGGIPFADMRFTSYLLAAWAGRNYASAKEAVLAAEERAVSDLKAASDKKGTLALKVNDVAAPSLPTGKIVLNFQVSSTMNPLPTRAQWDRVIQVFAAADPQVGAVNLRVAFEAASAIAAKQDCFYLPANAVPTMADGSLLSLDGLLNADPLFDKSDFLEHILPAVQQNNKTYALPIDIQPLILRYDSDRFKAVHLADPANNWTVDSFVDALKTLKANPPNDAPDTASAAPFADNNSQGIYLLVLIAAYGGLPVDYRTMPPTINFTDPATVTAIQQVLDLAKNGYIHYGALGNLTGSNDVYPTRWTALYPSTLDSFSVSNNMRVVDPNKVALFPGGQQYRGIAYNIGAAYISSKAQNPEACYRFISTMARHPELFYTMPVRRSVLSSAALKATTNPDVLALYEQVQAILKDPRTVPFPMFDKGMITPNDILTDHWLFEAFDAYILNGGDLEVALKEAEAYAKAFQTCTTNLPPLNINDIEGRNSVTRQYIGCALKVDPRLTTLLH